MPIIQLRAKVPESIIAARRSSPVVDDDFVLELTGDCNVYKPDGKPLCMLRRGALNPRTAEAAWPHLKELATKHGSDNRGSYAGLATVKIPGTKQTRSVNAAGKPTTVHSAIAGYFEPQGGRWPFCRQTVFAAQKPDEWAQIVPLVHDAAAQFKLDVPARCAIQQAYADGCSDDFRILGTPFSTITVNFNITGTVHKDAGDLKAGFGMISCHRRGTYTGGKLCFPQYKVAVDLGDRDLIYFDSHDWHGVTALHGDGVRISVVYYFREGLTKCGTAAEEMAKAKSSGRGAL